MFKADGECDCVQGVVCQCAQGVGLILACPSKHTAEVDAVDRPAGSSITSAASAALVLLNVELS